jgi:hypothetical protein
VPADAGDAKNKLTQRREGAKVKQIWQRIPSCRFYALTELDFAAISGEDCQ